MMQIETGELELAPSDARFFTTFNRAAVGIAHVSENGILLRANEKASEILGYSKEELGHKTFQELTYPPDLQNDLDALKILVSGEVDTYTLEKRYVRKDGSLIWAELTVSIVRPERMPAYFISVIVDISDRKLHEEVLQREHLELTRERELVELERDNFFNLSHDCLAISNTGGYFVRVNPAFCALLGYTSAEMTGIPLFNFIHPEDRERTISFREDLMHGETSAIDSFENRMITKNGAIKWISWTGRSIVGVANYISGRDITEKKAEELAARQQQVLLNTNLKLNAIGLMAANMAHEINNPLTIIYGEACLLRKMTDRADSDPAKLSRIAVNVMSMSERIVSIVNGLRTLSRDGSADPIQTVPLKKILDDTIPFCRGKIASAHIELKLENLTPDTYVCCRAVQLSQALLNLLNNAYDAVADITDVGRIEIFTRLTEARVEICVRDNGPGIDETVRGALFQPFTTSKPVGQGMGLGLSISREMIRASGGDLFLASDFAQTTFVISLPRVSCE